MNDDAHAPTLDSHVQALIQNAIIAERKRFAALLFDVAKQRRDRKGFGDAVTEEFSLLSAALLEVE